MTNLVDKNRRVAAKPFNWKASEYPEYADPGSSGMHTSEYLANACPGCGRVACVRVSHPKPDNSNGATWDVVSGSVEDVTTLSLQPSINCTGCCGWHGYLTNGVFVPC
jgi:hypothetical protein